MNNTCVLTASQIGFWALIPIRYSKSNLGAYDSLQAYYFSCSLQSKDCDGDRLSLDNIGRGDPISPFDFGSTDEAKLVNVVGKVYTIQWGPLRTFTIDLAREEVSYVESNDRTDGRGAVGCEAQESG
jgi:hypothetical protein